MTEQTETSSAMSVEQLLPPLAARLAPDALGIVDVRRLSGGATQEIWSFKLERTSGPERLILRRAAGGSRLPDTAVGLEVEAELMKAAAANGVPTPPVLYVLQPGDGLGHGFVMAFLEGETLGGRIVKSAALADAREGLTRACGEALARIHAIDTRHFGTLREVSPSDALRRSLDDYRRSDWPRPVLELAFRWLDDRCPKPPLTPRLVHGDFRNGNLMVGPNGLVAVLDWELAHIGDPMEDLGWLCANSWRFGMDEKPVGGFGERQDLWASYAAAGGEAVDPARALWWEVCAVFRWGCACAGMAATFRSEDPSVERAVIARRTSETELDLMRLIAAEEAL